MIITFEDYISTPGRCNEGGRRWAKEHNIDWNDFRKNGIQEYILEQFDDAIIKRIISTAKKRHQLDDKDNT